MSTPSTPVTTAPKLNAIQLIEQEVVNFVKQREQAVANVHAIEGAIQAAQHLLAKLRAEEAKAVAEIKSAVQAAEAEGRAIESKVVSIADAVKKEI